MTDLLDYLEAASHVLGPVAQIFKAAEFLFGATRPSRPQFVVSVGVDEFRSELAAHRHAIHQLTLQVSELRLITLTKLEYQRVDRDFIASQVSIAREIMTYPEYNSFTRARAAHTVMDLQALMMRLFHKSLDDNDSDPILDITDRRRIR